VGRRFGGAPRLLSNCLVDRYGPPGLANLPRFLLFMGIVAPPLGCDDKCRGCEAAGSSLGPLLFSPIRALKYIRSADLIY